MLNVTFVGRVTQEPKQFGKVVKFKAVHNEGKDNKNGYESRFVEFTVTADSFDGTDALKLVKGDSFTAVGEMKIQKWQKGDGRSDVMIFPRLAIPWEVKQRGAAEAPADAAPDLVDPLADIQF